eukprot:5156649-Prymnesium_polylepis.1
MQRWAHREEARTIPSARCGVFRLINKKYRALGARAPRSPLEARIPGLIHLREEGGLIPPRRAPGD